ncbi:MAG: methylmalonyl-CoA mutase family protein [Saprospiraceae bacterium]
MHRKAGRTRCETRNKYPIYAFDSAGWQQLFFEIAKLRALRLLWFNLLKAWEIPLKAPVVHASINSESYSDNLYSNMISGTTAAMSAIMGGVDRLTVLPYDSGRESVATYPKAFSRRIARNVQHLLKLESNLHELNDPAAGSYYIEHLSAKIAEKAWQEFKKLG